MMARPPLARRELVVAWATCWWICEAQPVQDVGRLMGDDLALGVAETGTQTIPDAGPKAGVGGSVWRTGRRLAVTRSSIPDRLAMISKVSLQAS